MTEDVAKLTAACDGMFLNVEYPFLGVLQFTDDDAIMEDPPGDISILLQRLPVVKHYR